MKNDTSLPIEQHTDGSAPERLDFANLYERYVVAMYAFFYRRLGNAHDAEDLTAVTFSRALASLSRYQEQGRIEAWLFGIARHVLQDHHRRYRLQAEQMPVELILADVMPLPEAQVLQSEQAHQLQLLVERLPIDQREALILRFFGEMSIAEIASLMGRSPGAVKMLIQRAMATLREHYRRLEQRTTQLFERITQRFMQTPAPQFARVAARNQRRQRSW